MGLMFFPRGGSSHVAQNLAAALPGAGWRPTILSGSLSLPGRPGDARAFYHGLDVHTVDFTPALEAPDPLARRSALPALLRGPRGRAGRGLRAPRRRRLRAPGRARGRPRSRRRARRGADVLHLHHLTPLNEAAARVAPGVPVVGHLHGTELLMLEAIEDGGAAWPHGAAWERGCGRWAARCARLIVLSDTQVHRAERLLGIDGARCVQVSNGFDPELFHPREIDRAAHWRRHLVDEPQGWRPGEEAGSVGYAAADLEAFVDRAGAALRRALHRGQARRAADRGLRARPPGVRAPRAARARRRLPGRVGGRAPGGDDRPHGRRGRLPRRLARPRRAARPSSTPPTSSCCHRSASSSARCWSRGWPAALPAIAVDAHGPGEIVSDGETGWLVEPDDRDGLAAALVEAVNRPEERRRRGDRAREVALERYSWPALAERGGGGLRGRPRAPRSAICTAVHIHPPEPLLPFALRLRAPARAPGARHAPPYRETDTAGRPVRPQLRARRLRRRHGRAPQRRSLATRRSSARSSRSRTSSTAAPRAPTRTPATAPGCCSSCPTSCCVLSSDRTCRRPGATASRSASCPRTTSAAPSSRRC